MRSKFIVLIGLLAFSSMAFAYGDYISLRDDVVDMLDFRAKAFREFESLQQKTKRDIPLNGGELNMIHETVRDRQLISERVIKYVLDNLKKRDMKKKYKQFLKENQGFIEVEDADKAPLQLSIDEEEKMSVDEKRSLVRALGMAMTLSDNFLQAVYFYHDDDTLRRIINESDSIPGKPGNQLRDHIKQVLTRKNRKALAYAMFLYTQVRNEIAAHAKTDDEFKFWYNAIEESYLVTAAKKKSGDFTIEDAFDVGALRKIVRKTFKNKKNRSDFVYNSTYKVVHALSKAFGNTAGAFQSRSGYLKGREDVIKDLKGTLRPLDILLEKTPFRLTDSFIPGYYGHNAIWLGTEADLKVLGLWDHPVFVKIHDRIRQGKGIVEALRPGVTTNTVEHFLDIDDMAVMRIKQISDEELKKNLIVAASQYGKAYDFNFDVETQDVLVCSELIFMSFLEINWRTEKVIGRWTINPDAIAERGRPGQEFNVVTFYTGGQKVTGKLEQKMAYTLANEKKDDADLLKDFKIVIDAATAEEDEAAPIKIIRQTQNTVH